MNNLIKIILIILFLIFLFKNNKVEKFTKNIFDGNVTLKLIPCDKNSTCKESTYAGEKYAVCNVTENGKTKSRYCLNKKQIRDNCRLSKLNSENQICNKILKQPTSNDSKNIFNSNVTLKLINCNSQCEEEKQWSKYASEPYAVCKFQNLQRYCLNKKQIIENCKSSIFNDEQNICKFGSFRDLINDIPLPKNYLGDLRKGYEGRGYINNKDYICDNKTGLLTASDGSTNGPCQRVRYV